MPRADESAVLSNDTVPLAPPAFAAAAAFFDCNTSGGRSVDGVLCFVLATGLAFALFVGT